MKIVYVDTSISGHHISYLNGIIAKSNNECILVLPEYIDISKNCKQYICKNQGQTLKYYLEWIKEIHSIIKKEKPDIVHFLYGDLFYRFFGLGLSLFAEYKTIMTMHWLRTKKLERISTQIISRKVDKVVVHSEYIKKSLNNYGIKNVEHIEYPCFNKITFDKATACKYWGIDMNIPCISCIGNTRKDKGLDILLEALGKVEKKFQLLIAGKAEYFNEDFISQKIQPYSDKVHIHLEYLSDKELSFALAASDIIVLPYRKNFNGASGPLGEGVALNKCIIGSSHGTLGYTIKENHLGYVFNSEDVVSLSNVLNECLGKPFEFDKNYIEYRNTLNPKAFYEHYNLLYESV